MNGLFKIYRKVSEADSATERLRRIFNAKKRLLLVDDEPDIIHLVAASVDDFAIDLVAVESVAAARFVLNNTEPFEAAILDVRLINGSGIQLYKEMIARWPRMSVVFMTGYTDEVTRAEIEAVGPARVFDKANVLRPEFFDQLLEKLGVNRLCVELV